MNGKTAEARHAEHDLMYKEFEKMQEWREKTTESITSTLAAHADVIHASALDTQRQLAALERGISEKTSMDSGLMVRQSQMEAAFAKLDDQNDRLVKTTERISVIQEQQTKQIDDAHAAVRGVSGRVKVLEGKSGKLALKIVFGALGVICTVGLTLLATGWIKSIIAALGGA